MRGLSESHRKSLRVATERYRASFPDSPAAEYLASRGLAWPSIQPEVDRFMLGYVRDPMPGHEMHRGMLAIPYLRGSPDHGWVAVSIRFRRLDDGTPKYMTVAGDRPRLYNTLALLKQSPTVAITEGEIDAITAQACGIPAVGVPGAQAWKQHFRGPFLGYREVFILADGDEPGLNFANTVAKELPNSKVIPLPPGEDVNSLVISRGAQALLEKVKP